jgi:hypothetical protein
MGIGSSSITTVPFRTVLLTTSGLANASTVDEIDFMINRAKSRAR